MTDRNAHGCCLFAALTLLACCSLLGVAQGGIAESSPNVTIGSNCPPAYCYAQWYMPWANQPIIGDADFIPAGYNWQFSFFDYDQTAFYQCPPPEFCVEAWYGNGGPGSFTLTGPQGTFSGEITSGYSELSQGLEIYVSFFGEWSDGQYAAGTATLNNFAAGFNIEPVPEPGSLLLFGSGVLGLGGLFRWKLRT
jgi:hypothetical protein